MNKYLLTELDGETIVTNEEKTYCAQYLLVEEALEDGLSLENMIEEIDDFMKDWIPINQEYGWGITIEEYESEAEFEPVEIFE